MIPTFAFLSFMGGLFFRWYYLFVLHPLTRYLYSDMKSYADLAWRLYSPGYHPAVIDVFYPPGTALFFGALIRLYPSWSIVMFAQFVMSVSIPVIIALISWELYGKRVALISLLIASLYFPFVEYAAYFLSENPFTFFFLLAFWLLVKSLKSPYRRRAILWGLFFGIATGVASMFRNVLLLPILFILVYLLLIGKGRIILASLLGIALVLVPVARWCTRANEGKFCVISNNGALGVLQGHYGNTGHFYFQDSARGLYYEFGSPASLQKGMVEKSYFSFGTYESSKVLETAWNWISRHPAQAFQLSFAHIADLFVGTIAWPTSHTAQKPWMEAYQYLYLIFILLPAVYYIIRSKATDLLLMLPLFGLLATVFITIGEPRYRIPFDSLLIILAARAYTLGKSEKSGFFLGKTLSKINLDR